MTMPNMNAFLPKKWALIALAPLLVSGVVGCAGQAGALKPGLEPLSPRVEALVDANRRYPQWKDFPRSETSPLPPEQVAQQVAGLDQAASRTAADAAAIAWTLDDPDTFVRDLEARVASQPVSRLTQQTREEIDAFAEGLRTQGRAPPPIPRR